MFKTPSIHITGGSGRRGARRGGGARRSQAEQDVDGSGGPEANRPLSTQGILDNCPERPFASTNIGFPV